MIADNMADEGVYVLSQEYKDAVMNAFQAIGKIFFANLSAVTFC